MLDGSDAISGLAAAERADQYGKRGVVGVDPHGGGVGIGLFTGTRDK